MHSQHQWWLPVCGASGDACCDAGSVGAPGAPLWRVGAFSCSQYTWVCAVLGGCRQSGAGCCVLCFLFCACVPLLTVWMLCSSYLSSGLVCATPAAYSASCLVLRCTAPLDVSGSHTPKCYLPLLRPHGTGCLLSAPSKAHSAQHPLNNNCSGPSNAQLQLLDTAWSASSTSWISGK